jgi:hypothetical protein
MGGDARTLRIYGWLKEAGDRLARPNSSPALERLLGRPIARRAPGHKPTTSITGVQLKLLQ